MRRATLIFNPNAGRRRDLALLMPALVQVLADHGLTSESAPTTGPGTADTLASQAAASGTDIVFACGGDGTVREVLQGLVGTATALGIVPIGTANALARNLVISLDPIQAVAQQASVSPTRIAVGHISYTNASSNVPSTRYFTVIAGAGPDGALVHSLLTGQKSSMGRTAYYLHAARLFVTRRFPPFRVSYRLQGSEQWHDEIVVSIMAARISNLGGIFSRLTPGASLYSSSLRLFLVRPPAPISLPSWFLFGQLGMHRTNPRLRMLDVAELRCEPLHPHQPVHAQVDGEWIGSLPVSVKLIPDALSLLIPTPSREAHSRIKL